MLATSRRGGRRVRKKKLLDDNGNPIAPATGAAGSSSSNAAAGPGGGSRTTGPLQTPARQTAPRDAQGIEAWQQQQQQQQQAGHQHHPPQPDPAWTGDGSVSRTDASQSASRRSSVALEGHLAAADLLNPSDALDLLAQVADLEPGSQDKQSMPSRTTNTRQEPQQANLRYPPISDGALGYADAAALIQQ